MNKKLFSFFLSVMIAFTANAQFVVTPGGTAASVASAIGGAGLTISNVVISCNNQSYGSFSGGASSGMGIGTGLALTTGKLSQLPGTGNVNDDLNYCVGSSSSDPQLTALSASATYDVCIIQFDVVPQCTNMGITFVFGSDEYTNWINQTYNDAFGFFVSGPNPGGGSYSNQNIAVIPSGVNVSVDNVNPTSNPAYFVNNNSGTYANHFDGFTTVLTPSIAVTPCATYHIKLAIADASDCHMDSGVLINVIQCNNVITLSTTNTPPTACGLNNGTATVNVTNGIGTLTYNWSPAPGGGQGTPNATGLSSGTTYTVTVDDAYPCIPPVTATVTIGGPVPPTVAVSSSTICAGNNATLSATPSTGGGSYSWSPGGATTQTISVSPASTTTYTCSYTLSGCTGTSTGTVTVNPQPNISAVAPVCSGAAPFNLSADVSGGTWSGTGITSGSAGTFNPGSASTGTNVITYTVSGGCNDTVHIQVTPGASATWTQPSPMCVLDAPINLSTYVTGTSGGTFSGSGVTGTSFNPAGLSGNIPVTYTVGSSPCTATSTLNISVAPNSPPVITAQPAVCSDQPAFNLSASVAGGTWSGTGITNASAGTFNPSTASTSSPNQVIYMVPGSCAGSDTIQVIVNPAASAAWTAPAPMCSGNGAINLDSLISGTSGGTWSGTGVTGHSFNPSGLSGSIAITYMAGSTCADTLTQNITVVPSANAAWTTTTLCASGSAINLDSLVTGTSGGSWSGTGVTGNSFNPSGLSGAIAVTYTVGASPCTATATHNINVITVPNAAWSSATVCSNAPAVNLDSLVTGTTGGTWSGTGVTGSSFNPSGLSGPITITYTVGATGCQATSSQSMNVTPSSSPAWTTTTVCAGASPINLNTLVTGTTGGTWSGTGVTGNTFDPSGLSGTIAVTYTVGTSPCIGTSTQNITVTPVSSAAWSTTSLCADAAPVNLNTLVSGTAGGAWSGTGVTGNTFDPSGLSGPIAITYTVGTAPCGATSTQNINVTPRANATITAVSALCSNASPITLTAATGGGTWSGSGITSPTAGTFNPSATTVGTHTIVYSIGGTCGDADTITVTVLPLPNAAWTLQDTICATADQVNLVPLVTGTTGGTFSGTGVSGNVFNPSGLSGNTVITYTVTQAGCTSTSSQVINVEAISAGFTASPMTGMAPVTVNTVNTSTNATSYTWNFGNGQSSTATSPSVTYSNYGNYPITLTVTNDAGCTDIAQVIIHVDETSALAIPNVFTPNGDGHNDVFYPVVEKGLSEYHAEVYDRWGLKMHDWTDPSAGWDGHSKSGSEAPDGTYYYIVSGKGVDGKDYNFTGFITLIRK